MMTRESNVRLRDKECEYKVFHRKDFLDVLGTYKGSNPILVDFRKYLQKTEKRTESYREWTREGDRDEYLGLGRSV